MAAPVREISAVKDAQLKEAAEKSGRSVFVGNIPYEASDEELKDIFGQAGPVLSFRLVYDRETGKPKGYGFCEYKDQETAHSAMRNLNGTELHGRQLRVDSAASQKGANDDPAAFMKEISPYGDKVAPDKAPETITSAVASLPPEQMFELMKQMKLCIQNNPEEARQMLLQNPQLAYALLQAQVIMKIVDPKVADAILHQPRGEPLPIKQLMEHAGIGPTGGAGPSGSKPPGSGPAMTGPPMQGLPLQTQPPMGGPQGMPPPGSGDRQMQGPPMDERGMRGGPGGPPGGFRGGQDMPPMPIPPMQQPGPPMGGGPMFRGPDNMGPPGPMMDRPGPGAGPYDDRMPRGPDMRGPAPGLNRDMRGPAPQGMDPRFRGPHPGPGGMPPVSSFGGPAGPGGPPGGPPMGAPLRGGPPMGNRMPPPGTMLPPGLAGLSGNTGPGGPSEEEKQRLIMQVLNLTDEQIRSLPDDQRESILLLKSQISQK